MRFNLLGFLLLVILYCAFGDDEKEDVRKDDHDTRHNKRDVRGRTIRSNGMSPDLYYPCEFEDDVDCVRSYLASTTDCKEAHNYGNKPFYRDLLDTIMPTINFTLIMTRTRIIFSGDRISSFYINKTSNNLVMAIDFDSIRIESRNAHFIFHRRGQEPVTITDRANGTFGITLTAVIPLSKDIQFSRVTPYISSFAFGIGPKVLNSQDPVVIRVLATLFADPGPIMLQYYYSEAANQFFAYLQKYICDFGVPVQHYPN